MSDNLTNFSDFVNKKKRIDKTQIIKEVFEYLNNSNIKMSIYDLSKSTGYKTDHVYTSLIKIDGIKTKKINETIYWYLNDNQLDPVTKKIKKFTSFPK